MAIIWKFDNGFVLENAKIGAFKIDVLAPIREVLAVKGLIEWDLDGAQPLRDAWMYLTPFTYTFRFEGFGDAFERYELYAGYLVGEGEVLLNGLQVCSFDTGELRVDVTGYLEEQNELRITFKPFIPEDPTGLYDCGIYAGVSLRASNFLTLRNSSIDPQGLKGVRAKIALTAHCAGRYDFIYAVSRGDELVKKFAFSEKLRALPSEISHELPTDNALNETYALRLTIERGGVACDEWDTAFAFTGEQSSLCAIDAEALFRSKDTFDPSVARDLRINLAQYKGRLPSFFHQALECGLCLTRAGDFEVMTWPEERGLKGAEIFDEMLSRALIQGKRALLMRPPTEEDADRFAYQKLKARLRSPHAFVARTDDSTLHPGQPQVFEIWFAGDTRADYPLSVMAVIYDKGGVALKSSTFVAYTLGTTKLGEMRLNVPESLELAVIRVVTSGFIGGKTSIQDAFFVKGGLHKLSFPPIELVREDNRVTNPSSSVAFVMVRGKGHDHYGALLPGEFVFAPQGSVVKVSEDGGEIEITREP